MDGDLDSVERADSPEVNPAVNAGEVLALLDRILASPQFVASAQLRAFLAYVVREELAGRGEKIKAYTVAIDALGRTESFDPSADPVIRVVANRLRKALDGFYAEAGDVGPVRIDLVKGSYRPVFPSVRPKPPPAPRVDGPIPGTGQPRGRVRPTRTYILIIAALALLLAGTLGYIASHLLDNHFHMEIINEVPPELTAPESHMTEDPSS